MNNDTNNHVWEDSRGVHVADVSESAWNAAVADGFSDYDEITKPYRNSILDRTGLAVRSKIDDLTTIDKYAVSFFDDAGDEAGVVRSSEAVDGHHRLNIVSQDISHSAVLPDDGSYFDNNGEPLNTGYLGFDTGENEVASISNHAALAVADADWTVAPKYRRGIADTNQFVVGTTDDGTNDVLAYWSSDVLYAKKDIGEEESSRRAALSLEANELGSKAGVSAETISLDGTVSLKRGLNMWESITNNLHFETVEDGNKSQAEFSIEKDGTIHTRVRSRGDANSSWGSWTAWNRIDANKLIKTTTQDINISAVSPGHNVSSRVAVTSYEGYAPIGVLDWWWAEGYRQNWFQNYGTHLEDGYLYYRFLNNHATDSAYGTLRVRLLYVRAAGFVRDQYADVQQS